MMHEKYLDKSTPIFAKNPQNEVFNFLQNTSGTNLIKRVSKEGFVKSSTILYSPEM